MGNYPPSYCIPDVVVLTWRIPTSALLIAFVALCLVLIAGLRPVGLDRDSLNYAAVIGSNMGGAFFGNREPTFWLINAISQRSPFPAITTFFLLYALLGVFVKTAAILKLSPRPLLSLYLYITLYFVSHEFTQIRTGIAAGIYLFALHSLSKGNRGDFLFRLFVATCFHYSAVMGLVMLVSQRFSRSSFRLFALPLIGIALSQILTAENIELLGTYVLPGPIQGRLFLYLELLSDDRFTQINLLNPVTTSFLVLYWLLVLKIPVTARVFDRYLLLSFGVGLASFYAASVIPVVAFRTMEFLSVGIVILLASATFWFRDKQIWIFLLMLWALTVFIVQSLILSLGVF